MKVQMPPTSKIKADLGIQPNGPIQKFFTETCYKHMDKYVPYSEGDLAYNTATVEAKRIIYDAPYAHYMYEGKVMGPNVPIKEDGNIVKWISPIKPKYYTGADIKYNKSAGHPFAGPYWDERMWSAEKDEVVAEVQEAINHGGIS